MQRKAYLINKFDFPPWWKESFPVMESNFLHGGKNKYLLRFYLTVATKRDKSGNAAA